MRAKDDVAVGATYIVNVPQRIPPALRDSIPRTAQTFAAYMRRHLHRGRRFDLTVTDVGCHARTVDGIESEATSKVDRPLTGSQMPALGLPEGVYRIDGLVYGPGEELAKLPTTLSYAGLPIRRLDPLGTLTALSDLSAAYYRWQVRKDARRPGNGPHAYEAREMLEKQREVAARALDDYDAERHLREVEVQLTEWQRIEVTMRVSGSGRYRPENDPELDRDDLKNPFTRDAELRGRQKQRSCIMCR